MQIRKFRWSKVYESAEEELIALLDAKNLQATRWDGEDGEEVIDRQFTADTQLWCAEGQLICTIQNKTYSLQPGDALDVPAGTVVTIHVGFGGCATYETIAETVGL
jgi:quercetin dioxygenase-like cupin family protein